MPSFFKKLLYGKELSNPYVNRDHPGHISTPPGPPQHVPNYVAQATNPHPTSMTVSTRLPPRPDSPTYLEEARRLAGRDPVTGRPVVPQQYDSYAARSGQSISQTGWGNPQPSQTANEENPYVTGGGSWSQGSQDWVAEDRRQIKANLQSEQQAGTRHDVVVREERRVRMEEERAHAERLRTREIGGYFAPERPVVREYYGSA